MRWKPRTLRSRLLLALIAVEFAALALLIPNTVRLVERTAERLSQQRLAETIPLLGAALAEPLQRRDIATLERIIGGIVDRQGLAIVRVFDGGGQLLVEAMAQAGPGGPLPPGTAEVLEEPIRLHGRQVGTVHLRVSTAFAESAKEQVLREGLVIAVLEIGGSIIALAVLTLLLTRNLSALRTAAGAAATGDLSVRAPVHGQDDVADAVHAFNRMLASLDEAEARQAHSEALYRQLVEQAQQPILVLEGRRPMFVNPAFARLLGYESPGEVMAMESIDPLIAPEYRQQTAALAEARLGGRPAPERLELEVLAKGGRRIWLDSIASPIRWAGREALQVAAFDITDRKRVQLALVESEARYRSVVELVPEAILIHREGRILYANRAAVQVLGAAEAGDLVGTALLDYVHADDRAKVTARVAKLQQGTAMVPMIQERLLRLGGEDFVGEVTAMGIDHEGEPAVLVVFRDVTEQVRTEAALRESEARFRDFAESSSDWLWETDADDRFVHASHSTAYHSEDEPHWYLGKRREDLALDLDDTDKWAAYHRLIESRQPIREFVFHRGGYGGANDYMRINGVPRFDEDGRFLGYRGTATVISEQVRTQIALREAEERLRTVIQNAPLILYALDKDGTFVLSEGRELSRVGRGGGEVVGQSAFDVFAHLPERIRHLRRALAGEAFAAEVQVDDATFDAYHQPLFDAEGNVSGVIVVSVNVTERRQAEVALRETERQLQSVVDYAPLILFAYDPDGTILLSTGRGLQPLGLAPGELVGRSMFDVTAETPEIQEDIRQALAGESVAVERTFNGVTYENRHHPLLDESGRVTGVIGISYDVTERHRAEAALRESEARFRDFAEASSDWFWEMDAEGRLSYISEEYERITGESPRPYLGQRREDVALDRDDTAKWDEYRRTVAAREPLRNFAYLRRTSTGGEGYLRINGRPMFDEEGRYLGYRGTASEVTAEMRMQAALEASEGRYRDLIEGSLQGVLVMDSQWRVIFANPAAAEIYGYDTPQALMALASGAELVAPEDRHQLGEYQEARLLGDERPARYQHRGLRRDGSTLWLDTYVRVVSWDGAPAVQATLMDVTEQKAAEAELRRSEENFRRLIEDMDLATFIFDEDWQLVFLNRSAARLFGYATPQDMLHGVTSGVGLVHEEDRARLAEYREARSQGRPAPSSYEFRAVRRDGQLLWLHNVVSIVEWQGRQASMSVAVDVTEHKQREEELRQAQKMEVVGQLTGGVAHDFNNLLTVIMGNLELLRRRVERDAKLTELLDSAARAAERGATLTQRLLAFSRKQALKPEAVDVNRLVMGLADMLRRTLGEMIEVETVLAGGLWPALVDPNQLENTLLNLAVNARDAMANGGKMTIETANARLDDEYALVHEEVRAGQYVMLAVSDSGEGMSPEVLQRAFDPFFTTKEVGRGSGLGLSMIYGFVKQSGGHVKIYSEPGQGTTVKVYLPRAPQPTRQGRREAGVTSPPGRGEKILVVEDDASVRELAMAILMNLGYAPIAAPDGQTGLEMLGAHPDVALLFTDVVLTGGMSGVELAREAQQRVPGLRVLYTSGYTENAIIHHGRLDEGVELLEKPFRIDSLARKVQAVLKGD